MPNSEGTTCGIRVVRVHAIAHSCTGRPGQQHVLHAHWWWWCGGGGGGGGGDGGGGGVYSGSPEVGPGEMQRVTYVAQQDLALEANRARRAAPGRRAVQLFCCF
eukprot:1151112-Pelagomonas_calceolata.AAC.4